MQEYPKFSVLMSVYYKEKPEYLKQAIESILANTVISNEIVIVKDGKLTDELDNLLLTYENNPIFKIIGYEANKGLGFALNYGVLNCSNEIVARMDSDDICAKDRFEKQLSYLLEHSEIKFIGSNTAEFIETTDNVISNRIMPEMNHEIVKYSKSRNPFIHPSIMTYKQVILDAGNYQDCYLCEDYDLWVRILKNNVACYNIQENLVYMRVSKDFYKRRGGIKYCKSIISFKKKLYKIGYMSKGKYIKTKYATIIVSLAPSFVRTWIYKHLLRG